VNSKATWDLKIEGYASLFWTRDLNDDVTASGAFGDSLAETGVASVKMLHQHDDAEPIGVWDEIVEDAALDGLSIGFRQIKARADGALRVLKRVELWEVSVVTFAGIYNRFSLCLSPTVTPGSRMLLRLVETRCAANWPLRRPMQLARA
jgi:phage head maturation protease